MPTPKIPYLCANSRQLLLRQMNVVALPQVQQLDSVWHLLALRILRHRHHTRQLPTCAGCFKINMRSIDVSVIIPGLPRVSQQTLCPVATCLSPLAHANVRLTSCTLQYAFGTSYFSLQLVAGLRPNTYSRYTVSVLI